MSVLRIIIPAHNESHAIREFVESLTTGTQALDVIVVCNGCTDETAAEARKAAGDARVLEIETPSKSVAMQAADDLVDGFPRFYLDADIAVTPEQLGVLAVALDGGLLAVAPSVTYDVSRSSFIVRSYYRALSLLPAQMSGISGTGCMGLSREGRARFATWPAVIADDYFLDGQFAPAEKARVADVTVLVRAPRGVNDLMTRKLRTLRGNQQVDQGELRRYPVERGSGLAGIVRAHPSRLLDVVVFVIVSSVCRIRLRRSDSSSLAWARDRSREL